MTHEHYWDIRIVRSGNGPNMWSIAYQDVIAGSEWKGTAGFLLVDSVDRLLAEVTAMAIDPPHCKCEPPKPRYYVVTPNGSEIEQAEGAGLEYYPRDGYLQFSVNGDVSKSYRRSEWQSVIFK